MLLDSCGRVQEELWVGARLSPLLSFLALLRRMNLSSTLNMFSGNTNRKRRLPAARPVAAAEPRASRCLMPMAAVGQSLMGALKESVGAVGNGFVNPRCGFSALHAGDAVSPQAVSLLPLSQRMVAICPGFGERSWLLKTSSCNWAWRCPELLLGNPEVTLTAEQERRTLGAYPHFPNGEIRNWVNWLHQKRKPQIDLPHPGLVPCGYLGMEDEPVHQWRAGVL